MASVFEEPQQLLFTDPENNTVRLNHKVLEQLSTVTKNINCVAITGLYRTGKSYLLTRLASKYKGFALGSTIESKTKGIWAWCVDHPKHADQALLLLDTEGLGDVMKGNKNDDNKLFTLAILLSSTLIYNMLGIFDDDALNKLNFITEMSKSLKTSDMATEGANFDMYFPDFILTLRDFTLTLEKDGEKITADQYLEQCLKAKEGDSEQIRRFNEPRLCIREYFKNRKCFVFETPTSVKKLRELETLTDSDLYSGFVEDAQLFLDHVFNCCGPMKMLKGCYVSGRMFSSLAESYVKAIRQGAIPCIENALKSMAMIENEAAVKEAFDLYVQEMEDNAIVPTEDAQSLSDTHMQSHDVAFKHFIKRRVLYDGDIYNHKLGAAVFTEYQSWVTKNEKASEEKCTNVLKQLQSEIQKKLKAGHYAVSGGYKMYSEDVDELKRRFDETHGLGVMKEKAIVQYTECIKNEAAAVLEADKSIFKAEKARRLEGEAKERAERKAILIQNQNEHLEKEKQDMEQRHEKKFKDLQQIYARERDEERARMDEVNAKRNEEMVRLHNENLTAIEEQQKLKIENLREENERRDQELRRKHEEYQTNLAESWQKEKEMMQQKMDSRRSLLSRCGIM